jgi:hypothetical protein
MTRDETLELRLKALRLPSFLGDFPVSLHD